MADEVWSISTPFQTALRSAAVMTIMVTVLCLGAATGAGAVRVAKPRLISLSYGRYRPQGAPHGYLAFRLTGVEPGGQILEQNYETSDGPGSRHLIGIEGDSECGLGGRHNGRRETFYAPVLHPLIAGVYRVRVTVVGALCGEDRVAAKASRVFTLRVR